MNRKYNVHIYADSRGAHLQQELSRFNDENIHFLVHLIRGAGLRRIWEEIEYDILLSNNILDLVYIIAGVCDITDCYYDHRGRRTVLPPYDMDLRFAEIEHCMKHCMKGIANNFNLINPSGKLCFLQEAGIDIIRYNRIVDPIPSKYLVMQASLENNLRIFQKFTNNLNDSMKMPTPWSLEITNAYRHNKWIPIFDRLADGLHPSQSQIRDLSFVLNHHARMAIYRHI